MTPLFDVCGDMLELLTCSVLPASTTGYCRPWLVNLAHNRQRWLANTTEDTSGKANYTALYSVSSCGIKSLETLVEQSFLVVPILQNCLCPEECALGQISTWCIHGHYVYFL